ncbi:MAG: YdeI/OmpD-associated family protein [Chitinophagales bacterium]
METSIVQKTNVLFFTTPAELREWFQKNHLTLEEAWIGFYNIKSKKQGINWKELVDEALCFGWIDGIRKKLDEDSYCNRITPRRKSSNWSDINIKRIQELMQAGLVSEQGKHVFLNRDLRKQKTASFEQETVEFPAAYLKKFKGNQSAWNYFSKRTKTYQKQATWYVISAKQEETRLRRLEMLMQDSENSIDIKPLRRPDKKSQ